ncbi:DUF2971 domain-containing protein [Pseudomonas sp. LjRoot71]|uniref:DUF2971 domain-containing protein n=1 Tax=Pseudomonas sp. LjRoot71 TaxID=3342336 RepID=UPI003ECE32A5
MPLYKYVTAKTAIKILKGSIRFTQPGAFNDPFELLPQFITPKTIAEQDQYSLSVDCIGSRRKGILRNWVKEDDRYKGDFQARKIVESLNDAIGLLCLSRNPESLLMWGHYGDEYRGAIIEFDERHPFFEGKISVVYRKNRPVYDIADFLSQPFPVADLCIKPNVWSYEREIRIARPLSSCTEVAKDENGNRVMTMDVPIDCIRGVIMGERMTIENQRTMWELVKKSDISLLLAAVANWDYAFRSEIIKYPGPLTGSPTISPRTAHIFSEEPGQFGDVARWMIENHPASEFVNLPC